MGERLGRQIGNYRLVKLLGKGGFAEVYLGQHVRLTSKQAAIKILHLIDVDARKFQEEAETTEKLVHPHIVRLLDFDIEQGTPFLVLDYAPGGSLCTRHPKGSVVPFATIEAYLKELAPALQYAHDKHILHRDIKPDNMLIGRQGELLLSDFGIAVLSQTGRTSMEASYGIGGTPYYMAPEAYRGKPEKSSDQYAFAVVVYEWLCGSVPFSEGNFIQLGYQHVYEPVPPPRQRVSTIPPEVEQVVLKALAKDPQQRFKSVQAFAQAFTAAFERLLAPTTPAQHVPIVPAKTKQQWLDEGNAYYDAGQYDKAIADYTRALQLDPEFAWAYIERGNAYGELQQYDKAIADYDQALTLDPKDTRAYRNRGNAYYVLQQYDKAIADYGQALTLDPESALAYSMRGDAYGELRQYDKAIADYTQVLQLDPESIGAYIERGNAYYVLQQYDKAIADYGQALTLDPESALAYSMRGDAYYALQQYGKAIQDYDQALELDPGHANAQKMRQKAYQLLRGK